MDENIVAKMLKNLKTQDMLEIHNKARDIILAKRDINTETISEAWVEAVLVHLVSKKFT